MARRRKDDGSIIELLRSVDIFEGVPDEVLAQLAEHLHEVEIPAMRRLFTEGTPGRVAYVIVDGTAQIRVDDEVVGEAGPGGLVGEVALLQHTPRTATMSALTPMRLLEINARDINWLFTDASISEQVRATLAKHLGGPQTSR